MEEESKKGICCSACLLKSLVELEFHLDNSGLQ